LLEQAIVVDPHYGQAHSLLAASHAFTAYMGWTEMTASLARAKSAAAAAVRADDQDPWVHHALGCIHVLQRRWDDSLAALELALNLNPNFSLALGYQAIVLSVCGRSAEAIAAAQRALRLSPRDPFATLCYGAASYAQ